MTLLSASWRAVARPPLLIPVAVAALLALATVPLLDDGYADRVRIGVAMVLACAWAATADDPAHEVAAASPYAPWRRCAARLLIGLVVVVPVGVLVVAVGELQAGATRSTGAALQVLALLVVGPAIGFGLWAWAGLSEPAYIATVGVLCCMLALWFLPNTWTVVDAQPWGPPWEAVVIRWGALLLLGIAALAWAWRDPAERR
jgi:hypothetical protein